jgi:hypothetical protein
MLTGQAKHIDVYDADKRGDMSNGGWLDYSSLNMTSRMPKSVYSKDRGEGLLICRSQE